MLTERDRALAAGDLVPGAQSIYTLRGDAPATPTLTTLLEAEIEATRARMADDAARWGATGSPSYHQLSGRVRALQWVLEQVEAL